METVMKLKAVADMQGHRLGVRFKCPGCGDNHVIYTQDAPADMAGPRWTFNGDFDRPVLSPSILARSGHHAQHFNLGDSCWCTHNAELEEEGKEPSGFTCYVCHSFVGCNGAQPGQIVFLSDCTHHLAGKTVDLPEWSES